jgi:hypothetical protein
MKHRSGEADGFAPKACRLSYFLTSEGRGRASYSAEALELPERGFPKTTRTTWDSLCARQSSGGRGTRLILCQNGKSLPAPAAQISHVATAAEVSRLNGFEGQPSTPQQPFDSSAAISAIELKVAFRIKP